MPEMPGMPYMDYIGKGKLVGDKYKMLIQFLYEWNMAIPTKV